MRALVSLQLLSLLLVSSVSAQSVASSARATALRFALNNGIQLDAGNTVVIAESFYMSSHGPSEPRSREQLRQDASVMAAVIGPDVIVSDANKVLSCVRSYCGAIGLKTVVEVSGPDPIESAAPSVLIMVFSPSQDKQKSPRGTVTSMTVRLSKSGTNWIAVKTGLGPATTNVR